VLEPSRPERERQLELLQQVPVDGMRAVIARRMTQSLHEMAQLTLHRRVIATELSGFRASFAEDVCPSVNDVVLAVVARTLARHPALNATLEADIISRWRPVHLGVAVAVEGGLVVPVIRNADRLPLANLREEAARVASLARAGRLTFADLRDGTFTVTNLGQFGVDGFTPIINAPQVAILGVGRVTGESMMLSLTIDHRAVDGVPAAQFLADLAAVFENLGGYEW
jgi:pyruvate dehydrogenase E2 component (dihydrolipoamide acetyltransferase)